MRSSNKASDHIQAAANSQKTQSETMALIQQKKDLIAKATQGLDQRTKNLFTSWLRSLFKRFEQYSSLKQNLRLMDFNPNKPNESTDSQEELDNMDLGILLNLSDKLDEQLSPEERIQASALKNRLQAATLFARHLKGIRHANERNKFMQKNPALALAFMCTLDTEELDDFVNSTNPETIVCLQNEIGQIQNETDPLVEAQRDLIARLLINHDFNANFNAFSPIQSSSFTSIPQDGLSLRKTIAPLEEQKEFAPLSRSSSLMSIAVHRSPSPEVNETKLSDLDLDTADGASFMPYQPLASGAPKASALQAFKSFMGKYGYSIFAGASSLAAFSVMVVGLANAWNPIGWGILLGVGVVLAAVSVTSAVKEYKAGKNAQALETMVSAPASPSSSTARVAGSRLAPGGLVLDNGYREVSAGPAVQSASVAAPIQQPQHEQNQTNSNSRSRLPGFN